MSSTITDSLFYFLSKQSSVLSVLLLICVFMCVCVCVCVCVCPRLSLIRSVISCLNCLCCCLRVVVVVVVCCCCVCVWCGVCECPRLFIPVLYMLYNHVNSNS